MLIGDITENNDYENTGYTYQQLQDAVNAYIKTLSPTTSIIFDIKTRRKILKGFNYDSSSDQMTVLYKEETIYMDEVDDRVYVEKVETLHITKVVSLSTIASFISQP